MQTEVSVVITSYNQKAYLVEAIDSALGQTVRPREIIVADDHSTDGSAEVIQDYAARHPDLLKPVLQPHNVGIPKNRNAALRLAQGSHVCLLDGDDRLLPHYLKAQLGALSENPGCRGAYGNYYYVSPEGRRMGVRYPGAMPTGDILPLVAEGKMGLLRAMLMPLDEVRQAGMLDERIQKHDGYVLTLRLARRIRFAYVAEPIVEYRVHADSDSRITSRRVHLKSLELACQEVLKATAHLRPAEAGRYRRAWAWKLHDRRVKAEAVEGRRVRALARLVYGAVSHPGNVRDSWQLARWVLKA